MSDTINIRLGNSRPIQIGMGRPVDLTQNITNIVESPGKSAYQIWLDEGNEGTEQDFLDSLVGAQGIQGIQGEQGIQGIPGESGIITLSNGFADVTTIDTNQNDYANYTILANQMVTDGDTIEAEYVGIYAANTNNKIIRTFFNAVELATGGALAANGLGWNMTVRLIRTGVTTGRLSSVLMSNTRAYPNEVDLTGVDWTETNVLKLTLQTATQAGDVTGKFYKYKYIKGI